MLRDVRLGWVTNSGYKQQVILVLMENEDHTKQWAIFQGSPYSPLYKQTGDLQTFCEQAHVFLDEGQVERRAREQLQEQIEELQERLNGIGYRKGDKSNG